MSNLPLPEGVNTVADLGEQYALRMSQPIVLSEADQRMLRDLLSDDDDPDETCLLWTEYN